MSILYSQKIEFSRPKQHSERPIDLSGKPANTIKEDVANGKLELQAVCKIVNTAALNTLPNAPKKGIVAEGDLPPASTDKQEIQSKINQSLIKINLIEKKADASQEQADDAFDVVVSLRREHGFNVMEKIRKKYEDIRQKNGDNYLESLIQECEPGSKKHSKMLLYKEYSFNLKLYAGYLKQYNHFVGELTKAKDELRENELALRISPVRSPQKPVEHSLKQLEAAKMGKERYYGYTFSTAEKTYISTRKNSIFDRIAFFFSCNFGAINRAAKLIEKLS